MHELYNLEKVRARTRYTYSITGSSSHHSIIRFHPDTMCDNKHRAAIEYHLCYESCKLVWTRNSFLRIVAIQNVQIFMCFWMGTIWRNLFPVQTNFQLIVLRVQRRTSDTWLQCHAYSPTSSYLGATMLWRWLDEISIWRRWLDWLYWVTCYHMEEGNRYP